MASISGRIVNYVASGGVPPLQLIEDLERQSDRFFAELAQSISGKLFLSWFNAENNPFITTHPVLYGRVKRRLECAPFNEKCSEVANAIAASDPQDWPWEDVKHILLSSGQKVPAAFLKKIRDRISGLKEMAQARYLETVILSLASHPCYKEMSLLIQKHFDFSDLALKQLEQVKYTPVRGSWPTRLSAESVVNEGIETLKWLCEQFILDPRVKKALSLLPKLAEPEGVPICSDGRSKKNLLETLLRLVPKDPYAQTFMGLFARRLTLISPEETLLDANNVIVSFNTAILPSYPHQFIQFISQMGFLACHDVEKKISPDRKFLVLNGFFLKVLQSSQEVKLIEKNALKELSKLTLEALLKRGGFSALHFANKLVAQLEGALTPEEITEAEGCIEVKQFAFAQNLDYDEAVFADYIKFNPSFEAALEYRKRIFIQQQSNSKLNGLQGLNKLVSEWAEDFNVIKKSDQFCISFISYWYKKGLALGERLLKSEKDEAFKSAFIVWCNMMLKGISRNNGLGRPLLERFTDWEAFRRQLFQFAEKPDMPEKENCAKTYLLLLGAFSKYFAQNILLSVDYTSAHVNMLKARDHQFFKNCNNDMRLRTLCEGTLNKIIGKYADAHGLPPL